jgi:hypothetical protein
VETNPNERFADDDPEYAQDAVDDIDLDVVELEPADPTKMPKDLGDAGPAGVSTNAR